MLGCPQQTIERYVEGVIHFEPEGLWTRNFASLTSPAYIQDIYTLPSHREYITSMLRTILHRKTFKTQFNTCYRTIC